MNPQAGEHWCSELSGLDVGISARYHWSVARQLISYSLRHWNLRNLTLQQECYLTNTPDFFRNTHGSIMLPPREPRVFARLGSLAIKYSFCPEQSTRVNLTEVVITSLVNVLRKLRPSKTKPEDRNRRPARKKGRKRCKYVFFPVLSMFPPHHVFHCTEDALLGELPGSLISINASKFPGYY